LIKTPYYANIFFLAGGMNRKKSAILLLLLILLHIGLHLKYIVLAPGGFHLWRQTQGLAVARNFYEEDMNILKPRVDNRGNLTGISGMEFPLVNFSVALTYKIFTFNHAGARLVILFFSIVAVIFCYLFFKELFADRLSAFAAAFCLAFSPLFGYYALVMLPDIPMLAFIFASLFFMLRWGRKRQPVFFFLGLFFLILAGLLKVSALFIGIYFVRIVADTEENKNILKKLFFLAAAVLLVMAWYFYARHISAAFGNSDFRLSPEWPKGFKNSLAILTTVFLKWLPGFFLSISQLPLFLLGLVTLGKKSSAEIKTFSRFFLAGFLLYALMFFPLFKMHDYYLIPALPLLILPCAAGMAALLKAARAKKFVFYLLCLLLAVLIPLAGSLRFIWRFEDRSSERLHLVADWSDRLLPDKKELVIVGNDDSPSIYLYFFHRKGWSVNDTLGKRDFERMVLKGAAYLICDSKKLAAMAEEAGYRDKISAFSGFTLYRLGPSSFNWYSVAARDMYHFQPNARITNAVALATIFENSAGNEIAKLFLNGLDLELKKEFGRAVTIFQQIIQLRPWDARAYFHLGYCCGMMGNEAQEIESYLQAIARDSADIFSFFNLSFVLTDKKHSTQAEAIFQRPEMTGADPYLKNFYLGMLLGARGEYEKALRSYRQAMSLQPENELLLQNMGILYCGTGSYSDAIVILKKANALGKNNHLNHYLLAMAYLQEKSFAAAALEFRRALLLKPDHDLSNFYLGLDYLQQKSLQKAKERFLLSKRSGIKPHAVRFFLGLIYLLQRQPDAAQREYRELREFNQNAGVELINLIEMVRQNKIQNDSLFQAGFRAYASIEY